MPETFWCYDPMITELLVNELPATKQGFVTFGSLNTFCKTNERTFTLWAHVLRAIPRSRLLLLAPPGSARQRTCATFEKEGVASERIEFVDSQPRGDYMKTYWRIDIALDTVPYNGHTTSLDAWWMGVPVVTLVGDTVVGRAGLSQTKNLGLDELCAENPDDFCARAVALGSDLERLASLRATLRERIERSPLMDARRFARNLEQTLRELFREHAHRPRAKLLAKRRAWTAPSGLIAGTRRWRSTPERPRCSRGECRNTRAEVGSPPVHPLGIWPNTPAGTGEDQVEALCSGEPGVTSGRFMQSGALAVVSVGRASSRSPATVAALSSCGRTIRRTCNHDLANRREVRVRRGASRSRPRRHRAAAAVRAAPARLTTGTGAASAVPRGAAAVPGDGEGSALSRTPRTGPIKASAKSAAKIREVQLFMIGRTGSVSGAALTSGSCERRGEL